VWVDSDSVPDMTTWALNEVEAAVRASWSLETCDDADLADWSEQNPSRGQCGATALVLNDLLSGDLLVAEVHYPDGSRQGYHWWNRLPDGTEIDWSREQFSATETVQPAQVFVRPPELPTRGLRQYLAMRNAVNGQLNSPDGTAPTED
jgi:hypothetical protein